MERARQPAACNVLLDGHLIELLGSPTHRFRACEHILFATNCIHGPTDG